MNHNSLFTLTPLKRVLNILARGCSLKDSRLSYNNRVFSIKTVISNLVFPPKQKKTFACRAQFQED